MNRPPVFFHVFNLPSYIDTVMVKKELERIAMMPNGVVMILPEEDIGGLKIEVANVYVYTELRKRRHKSKILGHAWYFVDIYNLFDDVQLAIDTTLLSMAKREDGSNRPGLYDNVQVFPTASITRHRRLFARNVSVVCAESWQAAVKFESNLRYALFESSDYVPPPPQGDDFEGLAPPPSIMDDFAYTDRPEQCTPLFSCGKTEGEVRKTDLKVIVTGGGVQFTISSSSDNVFRLGADAVILPAKPNLRLRNEYLESLLNIEVTDAYYSIRESLLEKKRIAEGEAVSINAGGRPIVLACVPEKVDEISLYPAYFNAFHELDQFPIMKKVAIVPFAIENLATSAETAALAFIELVGEMKPTSICFVHPDQDRMHDFLDLFSKTCNSRGATSMPTVATAHERGKYDSAMSLPPKPAAKTTDADAAAAAAAAEWEKIDVPETAVAGSKKKKMAKKERVYGKRSAYEKNKHKAMTTEQRRRFSLATTRSFMETLNSLFPHDPDLCGFCDEPIHVYCQQCPQACEVEATEMCLRCAYTYHIDCLDDRCKGVCTFCLEKTVLPDGVVIPTQLAGGEATIKLEIDGEPIEGFEDSRGHIKIIYFVPSGMQEIGHPKPGEFCFGVHRVAYLPNTEKGRMLAEMLKIAFYRGLVFTVGRSLSTWQDSALTWNCIPHKTRLDGGRSNCGYPDPTYLTRLEYVLNKLGVASFMMAEM